MSLVSFPKVRRLNCLLHSLLRRPSIGVLFNGQRHYCNEFPGNAVTEPQDPYTSRHDNLLVYPQAVKPRMLKDIGQCLPAPSCVTLSCGFGKSFRGIKELW